MRFRLHSTYVNNLKEENPFCNIFLLWDTRKNIYEFIKQQPPDVFYEKTVIKNFAKFTEKYLYWSLFRHGCFPLNIAKFLRTTILENIWERMVAGWGSQQVRSISPSVPPPPTHTFWVLCPFYISEKKFSWNYYTFSQITIQSFTKYLRVTLVFMWNGALREKFNFCFWRVFC